MDKIVYSSGISDNIHKAYLNYVSVLDRYKVGHIRRAQAFLRYIETCEKENKHYLEVFDQLSK